jgi:hypothetical protein
MNKVSARNHLSVRTDSTTIISAANRRSDATPLIIACLPVGYSCDTTDSFLLKKSAAYRELHEWRAAFTLNRSTTLPPVLS